MLQLREGFGILLYGLGSKRSVIEQFRKDQLHDKHYHVVVNGFLPHLSIKEILSSISTLLTDRPISCCDPLDFCQQLQSSLACNLESSQLFFLLINSIDGPCLRTDKAQTVLSLLAKIPNFRIVASIDHINAPLSWDQRKADCFNWLWYDTTNYDVYEEETSYENSLLVQGGESSAFASVKHVLSSVTPNAISIFILLCQHQFKHLKDPTCTGLSFHALYRICRERFLVNTDATLRAQLTEFRDHKLIQYKKGADGMEMLSVKLSTSVLRQLIDEFQL
jgi:origin recognition complex subunit 2